MCLPGCRSKGGGGIEPISSGPFFILKSFIALPSATVTRTANQRGTGVLVLMGVSSALGVGEGLAVGLLAASGVFGTGTGSASPNVSSLSTVGRSGSISEGGSWDHVDTAWLCWSMRRGVVGLRNFLFLRVSLPDPSILM